MESSPAPVHADLLGVRLTPAVRFLGRVCTQSQTHQRVINPRCYRLL